MEEWPTIPEQFVNTAALLASNRREHVFALCPRALLRIGRYTSKWIVSSTNVVQGVIPIACGKGCQQWVKARRQGGISTSSDRLRPSWTSFRRGLIERFLPVYRPSIAILGLLTRQAAVRRARFWRGGGLVRLVPIQSAIVVFLEPNCEQASDALPSCAILSSKDDETG